MKKLVIILLLSITTGHAQTKVPFNSGQWKFETKDYTLETYLGKESIRLNKNRATLPDVIFENGIIEYDIALPQGRAFIGVMFRMQDALNYEDFYFRPHQSGNPDANQYTPVYNGLAGWQLYYGSDYATPVKYPFNQWMHVKLLVSGKYLEVYLDDMEKPLLFAEMKRPSKKGYLGISNFLSEGHFANFAYTVTDDVPLKSKPKPPVKTPMGTITKWHVSNVIPEKSLEGITTLKGWTTPLTWTSATTEPTGILNLAHVVQGSQENNTAFVRILVDSDSNQVKKFMFGFSDRVKVFCNDELLFSGEDNFTSRDYRFLGTIGYFDAVYLHLKKGRNEIRLAISENFGGWGLQGKFADNNGLKIAESRVIGSYNKHNNPLRITD